MRSALFFLLACGVAHADTLEAYTNGAAPKDRLPLVVVLHGYGGAPREIVQLIDGIAVKARVLAPHGSLKVGDGWAWLPPHDEGADIGASISAAATPIAQVIRDEVRERPTCGRPIVVGFSQGGFLSYALAAQAVPVVALALPISGFLPKSVGPTMHPANAPKVIAFHGDADSRVDPNWDRATQLRFTALGYTSELHTYANVGHTISDEERNDIRAAILAGVRAQGCAK